MSAKILIVDDDAGARESLYEALTEQGYQVLQAVSGKHVMEILHESRPHLMILDVIMEEQEGIETLREVRSKYPTMPVIMMSSDPFYLSMAEMLGADVTLEKPLDLWRLFQLVREFLAQI